MTGPGYRYHPASPSAFEPPPRLSVEPLQALEASRKKATRCDQAYCHRPTGGQRCSASRLVREAGGPKSRRDSLSSAWERACLRSADRKPFALRSGASRAIVSPVASRRRFEEWPDREPAVSEQDVLADFLTRAGGEYRLQMNFPEKKVVTQGRLCVAVSGTSQAGVRLNPSQSDANS